MPKPPVNTDEDFLKNPLRSRRFWVATSTVILNALISQYPPLENVREQLLSVITWLGITLVGGLSLTHAVNRLEPLWKSRRFWTAIGTAILSVGVAVFPPLAEVQVELIDIIASAGIALISGFTLTDVALLRGWTRKH